MLVTTPAGTNSANTLFAYLAAPTVASISPSSGPAVGGTAVTISGSGFTGATNVTIGGAAATAFQVAGDTSITATTPPGAAGAASVVVTTLGGSNSANSLFTYIGAPSITSISPSSGSTFGGDRKSTRLNSSHIPLSRMPSSA